MNVGEAVQRTELAFKATLLVTVSLGHSTPVTRRSRQPAVEVSRVRMWHPHPRPLTPTYLGRSKHWRSEAQVVFSREKGWQEWPQMRSFREPVGEVN